jgi:wyosine [tRNA(Phe)-imidazoG37] synthetase (radical SAM superfamily)
MHRGLPGKCDPSDLRKKPPFPRENDLPFSSFRADGPSRRANVSGKQKEPAYREAEWVPGVSEEGHRNLCRRLSFIWTKRRKRKRNGRGKKATTQGWKRLRDMGKTAFGPVPSRRLGRSLGINNIPPKICTYSCMYCQVGKTLNMQVERREFYRPEKIFLDVEQKVKDARRRGEAVDYLTFVPDGEPTLDLRLGEEIERLRKLELKIAVITNSSLIWRTDVREELCQAHWVSLKIDALSPQTWRKINRPHGSLSLDRIREGITEFVHSFKGGLATETMLIKGLNDRPEEIHEIARFLGGIKPDKSYVAIPIRPPAENWVQCPDENTINMAYQVFKEEGTDTEYLIGYEGNAFAFTGDVEEDLLSILSVHPMREEAVREFLKRASANGSVVEGLIKELKLAKVEYKNNLFYTRKLPRR